MYIIIFLSGLAIGWGLRSSAAAFLRQLKAHQKEQAHRQEVRKANCWRQVMNVGPKPKEVICK